MNVFGLQWHAKMERAMAEASFEADGPDFFYYPDHNSPGIPVSAAERLLYIDGPRHQFFAAIDGRPATGPKRSLSRIYLRSFAATPAELGLIFGLGSLFMFRSAVQSEPGSWQGALFYSAALLLIAAVMPLVARKWLGRKGADPLQTGQ